MIKETLDGLIVKVKIVPNSSRNDIILEDEFIKVKVTAQPIENKANKALVEYEAVQKWNGKLPEYLMGNSIPFINLPAKK